MSQVSFVKLDKKWKSVESLIGSSFDSSKTYQIENRGIGCSFLLEAQSQPLNKDSNGIMLDKNGQKVIEYKKGQGTLYAKSDSCSYLNISVIGE